MTPVVTPEEMAEIDAAAPEPVVELIDRAGRAVASMAIQMLGGTYGRVVNLVAGKGNNGNDGRLAAQVLRRHGIQVREFDATACPSSLPAADLVIDAAYGTGFQGTWSAPEIGDALVLAVDIPSGVDALTGEAVGRALSADRTVTFQALKPGVLFGAGAELSGQVTVADIGLDVSGANCHLVGRDDVAGWWPVRDTDAHKWNGAVRVIAGSAGMTGAATLCSEAAARCGAGLVTLSVPGVRADVRPEIIQHPFDDAVWADLALDDIGRFGALVIGPGLGRDSDVLESTRDVIRRSPLPMVIDGDALFALAGASHGAAANLDGRTAVLTPHDGEFERLSGAEPGTDRIATVRRLAAELACTVLLKGPTTVVADPDGTVLLVDHGDERLATAGSGDVLSGMIGAILARGVDPLHAAATGAWLHSEAAMMLPPLGLIAGDLVESLPMALAGVLSGSG